MGPQLYRCGNRQTEAKVAVRQQASMGPQLYRCGNLLQGHAERPELWPLQWGRNFIVAEINDIAAPKLCNTFSFNGAATLSLRKSELREDYGRYNCQLQWGRNFIVAEMWNQIQLGYAQSKSFNGAATLSLRKCVHTEIKGINPQECFNGAATLSLRKFVCGKHAFRTWVSLQWGRNFIVAEMRQNPPTMKSLFVASMGPQLYRCGNPDRPLLPYSLLCPASMGPQLYRCGNAYMLPSFLIWALMLQWGRNFIVAEMIGGIAAH